MARVLPDAQIQGSPTFVIHRLHVERSDSENGSTVFHSGPSPGRVNPFELLQIRPLSGSLLLNTSERTASPYVLGMMCAA